MQRVCGFVEGLDVRLWGLGGGMGSFLMWSRWCYVVIRLVCVVFLNVVGEIDVF